ncbi:uncharacterized protein LOC126677489 [Mercurialis annua]|uniref:uncharacterized protein LOC126677489 n=1 Tax=Mercurialis annua TaxID=3986 RepID=UPI002160924A|nr:uncharacterized protein LOC126677489 [Mercurialis annua]
MDPPPPSAAAGPPYKLRLMCSYGGQIIPRPNSSTKSLCYAGGDTRIITIPTAIAANLTLTSLATHLSTALNINNSFTLKYQLPSHDLDSLISVSNDDDLLIMLDEHHRLSPTPARIRLFLFPTKPVAEFNELKHPKTETWFADVLKSAKIMQKGGGGGVGLEGNSSEGSDNNSNNEVGYGLCGAESMVLETSSSFGSSSSSVSLTNLPAKGAHVEEFGAGLLDNKVKLPASESFATSDNGMGVTIAIPHTPPGMTYQEPVPLVPAMENNNYYPVELESKTINPSIGVEMHKPLHVSGFPLSLQFDQPQIQFVHTADPYNLPHNPAGMMPVPSYYVMTSPMPQQQTYYQTSQPAPIYFMPVGHPYNMPMQSGLVNPMTVASNCPPAHPIPLPNSAQVGYKVAAASPMPEAASQIYRTPPMPSSLVNVPRNESHLQDRALPQVNQQAQSIDVTSTETANYTNELDEDPLRIQIYKSQPPPPKLAPQCTTVPKATAVMLSEALAQLHTEKTKLQI